jgi:hypothetical protein
MYRTLTYDEFVAAFQPHTNHLTGEGNTFETYGEELEYVRQQDEKHIWTELDGDDGVYIVNGYHYVNRISYLITTIPAPDSFVEVVICLDKECDCSIDGEGQADCTECRGDGYITIYPDTRDQLIDLYGEQYANVVL